MKNSQTIRDYLIPTSYGCIIHSFIHPFIHPFIHSSIHPFIHSIIHPSIYPSIHSFIHSFIHSYPSIILRSSAVDRSAHTRYHPGELSSQSIDLMARQLHEQYTEGMRTHTRPISTQTRIQFYHGVTQHFTPVFHYFFLERFFSPHQWNTAIQHFISTLSTNSIVGYVVGMGDRHLRNILIDNTTGELIHIDFGIMFERGKSLLIPECIPFRLTREFVDCLGVEGVNGLLREQMENCLSVMKRNRELILTILGVFLHDPLNNWVIKQRNQNAMREVANPNAEQVLFRIENKLLGRDNHTTESVSVAKQVDSLIKQATNENNLALMYYGWAPWL